MSASSEGSRASAPCRSCACPGVRWNPVGLPRASHVAWILVVSPPLLRPIASCSRTSLVSCPLFYGHLPHVDGPGRWWNRSSRIRYPRLPPDARKLFSRRRFRSSACGAYGPPGNPQTSLANRAMRSLRGNGTRQLRRTAGYLWLCRQHAPRVWEGNLRSVPIDRPAAHNVFLPFISPSKSL